MDKHEWELLLEPAKVPETHKELRSWLKACAPVLADRTADEVAELALLVGFDRAIVYEVVPHFRDAMIGSSVEKRAQMNTYQRLAWLDHPEMLETKHDWRRPLLLKPLWNDLYREQTGEVL